MNKQLSILSAAVLALSLSAQVHALSVGDIAVIAYNSDGNDDFAWVALTDIAANTTLNFTDSSWQATAFRLTEHLDAGGPLTWSSVALITAGTVIKYSGNTDANVATTGTWNIGAASGSELNLSTSGDQIFSFQGLNASPAFVYGLQFANAAGIIAAPTVSNSTNTTNVPGSLSEAAGTMFNVGNFDNGYYSGSVIGSQAQLLAAIATQSNWTRNDAGPLAQSNWVTGMTVASPVPEADTYALMLAGMGLVGLLARRRKI